MVSRLKPTAPPPSSGFVPRMDKKPLGMTWDQYRTGNPYANIPGFGSSPAGGTSPRPAPTRNVNTGGGMQAYSPMAAARPGSPATLTEGFNRSGQFVGLTRNPSDMRGGGVNISIQRGGGGYSGPTQNFGGVPHKKVNGKWVPMRPQRGATGTPGAGYGGQPQTGLPGTFEQGVADANAANEARYQEGRDIYGNLLEQLGAPGDSFGQAGGSYADLLKRAKSGELTAGADALYDQQLALADSFGATQKEINERAETRGVAADRQHLIGSGLHNTTMQPTMARGRAEDRAFQDRAVDEGVAQLKLGVLGDKAGLRERDADRQIGLGGDMGRFFERMGDRSLGLSQDEIRFIENRTDLGPDAALFADLFRSAAGAPSSRAGFSGGFGFSPTVGTRLNRGGNSGGSNRDDPESDDKPEPTPETRPAQPRMSDQIQARIDQAIAMGLPDANINRLRRMKQTYLNRGM